jgi:hypothetical protein
LEGRLIRDLKNFDFLHREIARTRENRFPVQAGVIRVTATQITETAVAYVAVVGNAKVTEVWTVPGNILDCSVLRFGLQRKCPRQEIMRILQCEKKTFRTRKQFLPPLHWSEAPKMFSSVSWINERVTVAAEVKIVRIDAIAPATPQQQKVLIAGSKASRREERPRISKPRQACRAKSNGIA